MRFLRSRFVVTTLLLFAVLAAWALANPRYAAPDEPSHVRKAAALVRGEFFGDRLPHLQPWQRMVDIPIAYGSGTGNTGGAEIPRHPEEGGRSFLPCFALDANQTAACQHFSSSSGNGRFYTTASMYPPLYYSIVGLPTLVINDPNGVYVMRLVSALVVALLFAWSFELLAGLPFASAARSALLLGLTPMVIFNASSVNPIALEMAAAMLLWTAGLVLTRPGARDRAPLRAAVVAFGVAGVLLVLTRPLGWLWCALVVAFVVAFHGVRIVLDLVRTRGVQVVIGVIAIAGVVQAAYLVGFGLLSAQEPGKAFTGSDEQLWRITLGHATTLVQEMVGVFGWLDTAAPGYTLVVWLFAFGALVLLMVMLANRRRLLSFLGLGLVVWLLPVVLEARAARSVGIFWQGRYTLPLAFGLFVMGAIVLGERLGARHLRHRVRAAFVAVFVTAQFVAFYGNLHRYTAGWYGPLLPWHAEWSPPLTAFPLLALALVSLSAFAVYVTLEPPPPRETGEPPAERDGDHAAPAAADARA